MPELVARAVLKSDASGLVLAADQSEAALARVTKAVNDVSAAGSAAAPAVNTSAAALKAQADAAEAAQRALGAAGVQKKADVEALKQQAAANDNVMAKVQSLAAAYGEFNQGVSASETLLKAQLITAPEHTANMEGLAAKLALAKAAFHGMGDGAKQAEVDVEAVERMLASLGVQAGVAGGQIKILRDGIKAIPGLVAAAPLAVAFAVIAAAIGVGLLAENDFEKSVNRMNVTLAAHNLTVMGTSGRYLDLAEDMSTAAGVGEKAGRTMAGAFADANLSPELWTQTSAVARDYAAVLGGEVPDAAAKLAGALRNPSEAAKQLNDQYGLFDSATMRLIEHLDQMGATESADTIILDAFADRIKNAAEQTTGWAKAWDWVSRNASNAWDAIGNALFKSNIEKAKQDLASYQQELEQAKRGFSTAVVGDGTTIISPTHRSLKDIQADIDAVQRRINPQTARPNDDEARNREQAYLKSLSESYDQFTADLNRNDAERTRILVDRDKGIIGAVEAEALLAGNKQKFNQILESQAAYYRSLDKEAQHWYERIQSLVLSGSDVIRQSQQEAKAAEGQAAAYRNGVGALDAYNAKQEIVKATSAQTAAMHYLEATAAKALHKSISDLTEADKNAIPHYAELKRQIDAVTVAETRRAAAQRLGATMQDIDQRIGSASGDLSSALRDAAEQQRFKTLSEKYQQNYGTLMAWREKAIGQGMPTDWIDAYADKLGMLFQHDAKSLYEQNLRDHTDWASGIERSLIDLERAHEDWARTTEDFMNGWASSGEQMFVRFAATGKATIGDLTSFIEQKFAEMAYKRYLASSFDALGSIVLGGIDSIFGGIGKAMGVSAGVHHSGGTVGAPAVTRNVPAAVFARAERYHLGGIVGANDNLAPGERPIIAMDGERVKTVTEQRADLLRDQALVAALERPLVMQLPPAASLGGDVYLNVSNPPGTTTRTAESRDAQGNRHIDIINEIVDQVEAAQVERVQTGRSSLADALTAHYDLNRRVA
jgi:hypothetical protein